MNTPNLDCMTTDPDVLWAFAESLRAPRKSAARLFPDKPRGYVRATAQLKAYAYNKATAMRCREKGDVQAASIYETICDRIYSELPEYASW